MANNCKCVKLQFNLNCLIQHNLNRTLITERDGILEHVRVQSITRRRNNKASVCAMHMCVVLPLKIEFIANIYLNFWYK